MEYFFTFDGMFVLYIEKFCLRKVKGGNQTLKIDVAFS